MTLGLQETMPDRILIPNSVIGTVAEVLGGYYYSHSRLNTLFMEAGAPGDPPDGNCVTKCVSWLKRCNEDLTVKPLNVLGEVLQPFMDHDFSDAWEDKCRPGYERIQKSLAKNGLSYQLNGRILRCGVSPSSRSPLRCIFTAEAIALRTSLRVLPVATHPGRSGTYAE